MDLFANGFWTIVQHNWVWLVLALLIGAFIGWRTFDPASSSNT